MEQKHPFYVDGTKTLEQVWEQLLIHAFFTKIHDYVLSGIWFVFQNKFYMSCEKTSFTLVFVNQNTYVFLRMAIDYDASVETTI